METNTKKQRLEFVEGVKSIIINSGGVQINPEQFKITTKENIISLLIWGESRHTEVYSVFMKFDTPSQLIGNRHTGKHNFHSLQKSEDAVSEFEYFLKDTINKLN